MKRKPALVASALLALLTLGAAPPAAQPNAPKVDPKADKLLRSMSDFLGSQMVFSVDVQHDTQAVLESGEKLDFVADSSLIVQRPNHLRSDRLGELAHVSFYYDGKNMTLYGQRMNLYATAPAPATLDQAIDFARQKLNIEAPAADLLYANAYKVLMEDVVEGKYIAEAFVAGQKCHHLAYRGNETDWQIWIADGPMPLPLRFTIISKKMKSVPELTVEMPKWDLSPKLTANTFTFTPPAKAERIDFLPLAHERHAALEGKP
jgi:hypothetical protein